MKQKPQTVYVKRRTTPCALGCLGVIIFITISIMMNSGKNPKNAQGQVISQPVEIFKPDYTQTIPLADAQQVYKDYQANGLIHKYDEVSEIVVVSQSLWNELTPDAKTSVTRSLNTLLPGVKYDLIDGASNHPIVD